MLDLTSERFAREVVAGAHMAGTEQSRQTVERSVVPFGGQHEGPGRTVQGHEGGTLVEMNRASTPDEDAVADTEARP